MRLHHLKLVHQTGQLFFVSLPNHPKCGKGSTACNYSKMNFNSAFFVFSSYDFRNLIRCNELNVKKDQNRGVERHIRCNTILDVGDMISMNGHCTDGEGGPISI